jgi:hypothetical protein
MWTGKWWHVLQVRLVVLVNLQFIY